MASGVKVVGTPDESDQKAAQDRAHEVTEPEAEDVATQEGVVGTPRLRRDRRGRARPRTQRERLAPARSRRRIWVWLLAVVALLGIAGTVGFGVAWAGLHERQMGETQVSAAAHSFLVDLTNFDAKTVDADFSSITSMSTGTFATQAQKFFNSSIRQDLEKALASSRGQVRTMYVQSYGGDKATVYAVVDQLYVNDKISTPQTDVLRVVVSMRSVSGRWKVADVTVLQGPSLASPATAKH